MPDWRVVARAATGVHTVGYIEQAKFYYPLHGGIQALYNAARRRAEEKGQASSTESLSRALW